MRWVVLGGSGIPAWSGITRGAFFLFGVIMYTLFVAGLVVVGVPGDLFGLSRARRRARS